MQFSPMMQGSLPPLSETTISCGVCPGRPSFSLEVDQLCCWRLLQSQLVGPAVKESDDGHEEHLQDFKIFERDVGFCQSFSIPPTQGSHRTLTHATPFHWIQWHKGSVHAHGDQPVNTQQLLEQPVLLWTLWFLDNWGKLT